MEKFCTTLNDKVPFRNNTEKFMVQFIMKFLEEEQDADIIGLNKMFKKIYETYININPLHGIINIGDVNIYAKIAGKPSICKREFAIYGKGRKTYTLIISESEFKNSLKNFEPIYNECECDDKQTVFNSFGIPVGLWCSKHGIKE